jgi:phage terminase large subunit
MSEQIKISEKYEPLFQWLSCDQISELYKVDTVVITGGRYSQKSFAVGLFSCVAAKDFNHRILYTRYTLSSAEDSIIPEFNEKIEVLDCYTSFEVSKDRISGTMNQSKIVFKGIKTSSGNQTANLKSLKNFSMFILEEAEEMPSFNDWDKIKKSIRALDVRNLNVLLLNPSTKEHWIYKELYESNGIAEGYNGVKGNVLYIHSEYRDMDRQFIPDNIWEDFEDKRISYEISQSLPVDDVPANIAKKASYYKHVIKGGWLDKAEGVIFTNWVIDTFKEITVPVFGQDFGFSIDPSTLIKTSIDKANKKIYLYECFYQARLTTSDIADKNIRYAGDHLIIADSAEPRLITELKNRGCNVSEAVKGPGSISAGIAIMQDYQLVIDPSSINIIKELNNYAWNDKKSGTPVDMFNHSLDAARYAIQNQLGKLHKEADFGW